MTTIRTSRMRSGIANALRMFALACALCGAVACGGKGEAPVMQQNNAAPVDSWNDMSWDEGEWAAVLPLLVSDGRVLA